MKKILLTIIFVLLFTITSYAKPYDDIEMSEIDYHNLCRVLYAEGNEQTYEAQCANAEIILNRVLCKYRGDTTVGKVISRKGEFWGWNNKTICTQQQIDVVEDVLAGHSGLRPYIEFSKELGYIDESVRRKDYIYFCTVASYVNVGYTYMDNCVFIDGHVYGTAKKEE